jgi:quercetin dioxygenase-like cupin family protein
MKPVFHRPGNGETHQMGPSQIVIKAASEHTEGKFFLSESTIAPGFPGPPPHVHDELHDMFYVLDGALTMRLGDEEVIAEPGTFVCVPPGVVHTFSNRSDAPVRFLNFNTPGGWERYMRELVAAAREAGGQLSSEEIGRIASRHDFRAAG